MCADWQRKPDASSAARSSAAVWPHNPAPSTSRKPMALTFASTPPESFGRYSRRLQS